MHQFFDFGVVGRPQRPAIIHDNSRHDDAKQLFARHRLFEVTVKGPVYDVR